MAGSSLTVFCSVTALVMLGRISLWLAFKSTGPFRRFVLLSMRAPAVLLADVWFRGSTDKSSLYGYIADIMERAGWWGAEWPGNHIAYLKYFAIAIAFCLVFVDDDTLMIIYKFFFYRMAMIQVIYILSQQSVYRISQGIGLDAITLSLFCGTFTLYETFCSRHVMTEGMDDVCEGIKEGFNIITTNLRQSELPEWLTHRLNSAISTTLTSFASTNSNVVANVLILAPFFVTLALHSAGLPVTWVQWTNGAMFRALALILLFVVLVYICGTICTIAIARNSSPLVTLAVSWLTLLALNVIYHVTAATSSSDQFNFINDAFAGLSESLKSIAAYIGFSLAVGYVYLGIFRVIIWYAGIPNLNVDFNAVRIGQAVVMLLYGLDMYIFSKPSAQNSFIGALTVLLIGGSQAVVAHIQPVIESGVRSRGSSINALLIFCVVLFVLPLVMTYLVMSSFGLMDWCSQTVVMTLFTCLHAVKFIASYIVRNFRNMDVEKKERYLLGLENISLYANWTVACMIIFYYIIVFLSVDWSFTALYKAVIVTIAFVYKPYADLKITGRRRTMASRLVSSFPAPNLSDKKLVDVDCPICLVNLSPENGSSCRSPCGHMFHSRCLTDWVRIRVTCPMCNRTIGNLQYQANGAPPDMDQLARMREFQQQMEMLQQIFAPAANGPQAPQQAQQRMVAMWQQLLANANG